MTSNHLILCCPLILLPSIFPSIRVFSNESALQIRWPEYWSFSYRSQSFQFNCSVLSNSLIPREMQHVRLPCPSQTPRICLNSCASSRWCHPTISSSVIPFSCFQYFPASWSFQVSQFFTSGGQSIGVSASASVLPVNIQAWFCFWLTDLISLQSKGLSRVFSIIAILKHQFFSVQPS